MSRGPEWLSPFGGHLMHASRLCVRVVVVRVAVRCVWYVEQLTTMYTRRAVGHIHRSGLFGLCVRACVCMCAFGASPPPCSIPLLATSRLIDRFATITVSCVADRP